MSRISVGMSTGLAAAHLGADPARPETTELDRLLHDAGGRLEPMSAGLRPEDLDPDSDEIVWFTCEVGEQAANDLPGRLLDVDGVEAAFAVPPDSPP